MKSRPLPDSAFVVLALVAEGDAHGYEIQRLAHNRGFRFWTKLQRSSIYNALVLLEKQRLITAHVRAGEGPDRKVYRITPQGRAQLRAEAVRHLGAPDHPRSEIDLGLRAALPAEGRGRARV
jgi:DNA-binding PadR family transcriptional regulator